MKKKNRYNVAMETFECIVPNVVLGIFHIQSCLDTSAMENGGNLVDVDSALAHGQSGE